ncbi:MAG: polyprenyl synthetase family protein [Lactobacillaceae bacterium]|jgi:geranylgeranyl diphosphate synthase type II|nr:polyprenyl synthetase family protein [Lactobacillaceae bacterium]
MKLADFAGIVQPQIEHVLTTEMQTASQSAVLAEAMTYAVMTGGKRLRPLLTLAVVADLRGPYTDFIKVASALELIHTYSLIHDDLPAMDDDDLRRGKPTVHRVYGEALAILAGDALQALAYSWLGTADALSDAQKAELMLQLAQASGADGMVAGQVADMLATDAEQITVADAKAIHYRKTGALLGYAAVAGGIMAKTNVDAIEVLWDFGMTYGLAFQIKDDLLDLQQDANADKQSYPALLGQVGARVELQTQVATMEQQIELLQQLTNAELPTLVAFLDYFEDMVD